MAGKDLRFEMNMDNMRYMFVEEMVVLVKCFIFIINTALNKQLSLNNTSY